MDNHLLTTASEDTLVTAFGTREIQSGQDTPHPETRLSTETVQVLKDTAARLEKKDSTLVQPSNKKRRLETNDYKDQNPLDIGFMNT